MLKLLFAAGLIACATPAVTIAQPYGDASPRYQSDSARDDANRDSDDADSDTGVDSDADYDDARRPDPYDRYDRDESRRDYAMRGDREQHYTGRVGAAWIDAEGRSCRWREVSWPDHDGNAAYKWVTVCRD